MNNSIKNSITYRYYMKENNNEKKVEIHYNDDDDDDDHEWKGQLLIFSFPYIPTRLLNFSLYRLNGPIEKNLTPFSLSLSLFRSLVVSIHVQCCLTGG